MKYEPRRRHDMMGTWLFCYSQSMPTVCCKGLSSFIYYVGAALSLKSVFNAPFKERLAAYNSKLTWADSSCSDCISFLNAYKVCILYIYININIKREESTEKVIEIAKVLVTFNPKLESVASFS
jgi:hypothetical protein